MMLKRALSSGEDFGAYLLTPGRPSMTKTAGMVPLVEEFIAGLRPDPRYMYTLVNAMGYSEFYGPNSNRDYYGYNPHLDFNGLLHAPENCGCHGEYHNWCRDPVVQSRLAKSWPFGYPSFYGATVYAHHKNTDPGSLGFGDVVYAAENEAMKRIELVMRVDVDLAVRRGHTSILDRIKRGERTDVSMGCKVPFDNCSICTDWEAMHTAWKGYDKKRHASPGVAILAYHRTTRPIRGLAVTKADYCEHMVNTPGAILPDGQKVFVYNDFPKFFDISFVWVGADRTARVMWYMGDTPNRTSMPSRPTSISEMLKGASDMTKTASAERTKGAEMEKEISGGIARKIELCSNSEMDLPFGPLAEFSKLFGARTLLSTLGGLGVPLKPQEFHAVISVERPLQAVIAKKAAEEGVTFRTDLPGTSPRYAVDADSFSPKLAEELLPLLDARSSFGPHLHVRLATTQKTASEAVVVRQSMEDVFAREVAAEYNGYRASLLKEAGELLPKYYTAVPTMSGDLLKTASSASLLLSPHAVVHWISAHLDKVASVDKELAEVMKYVMAEPDYRKLSAIGAEVSSRMDSQTGFLDAFKKAVNTVL